MLIIFTRKHVTDFILLGCHARKGGFTTTGMLKIYVSVIIDPVLGTVMAVNL